MPLDFTALMAVKTTVCAPMSNAVIIVFLLIRFAFFALFRYHGYTLFGSRLPTNLLVTGINMSLL